MKQSRPERERRRRRRVHPLRIVVVGAWLVAAFGVLVGSYGSFWRDVDYWMDRAIAHADAGRWAEALHYVGRAMDGAPNDPGVLTFAGHAHGELGQWQEAARHFERALEVDAGRPEAALGLGEARLSLGDDEGAVRALATLRLDDADPDQRTRAAGLAEQAGDPALALRLLESIPGPDNRLDRARLARATGAHAREVELLEQAGPEGDAPVDLRRAYGRALQDAGRTAEAEAVYEALHREGLLDVDTGVRYAWLLNERGRHAHAVSVLERTPPDEEVVALTVRSAIWADDLDRARALVAAGPVDAELGRALGEAEARRARAMEEAEAARLRATPPADPVEALAFWRRRVQADPQDAAARAELVALLEAGGHFEEALSVLAEGPEVNPLHVARLSLWAGRPADAVRALDTLGIGERGREGHLLLAEALLATDEPERAYRVLAGMDAAGPAGPDVLLLRVRATDRTGRTTEAAGHLAALARMRDLTVEERAWLAGLLWRSGGLEGALAGYEGLLELRPDDAALHRSTGDLRMALGDPAGAERAYRTAVELAGHADPAARGLALALMRQNRSDEAVTVYEAYLDELPGDAEARLALARAHAGTGAFVEAAAAYERYAAEIGPALEAPVAGEIADVWMALGEFERAEPWVRRAAQAPNAFLPRVRLAHVLALLDRHEEAGEIIDGVEEERIRDELADDRDAVTLEDALVDAWIARLRGRPLAAVQVLEGRIDRADTTAVARRAWIFLAEVSEARGDVADARSRISAATAAGARPLDVRHVQNRLDARGRPRGTAAVEAGSDANRLDVVTAWARVGLRPTRGAAPALAVELRHREASQLDAGRSATAISLEADSLFLSRPLQLRGRLGLEASQDGGARMLAGLGGTLETPSGHRWSLDVSREPLWSEGRRSGAPEYGRVRNLGVLDPELMVSEARLRFSTPRANQTTRGLYVESGAARYSDGNRRVFGYAEMRQPLASAPEHGLALLPNVYVEGFGSERTAYASPTRFLALGLALDAEARLGSRIGLEVRGNPHYFRFGDIDGFGLEAQTRLSIETGIGALRLTGRYLRQGDVYDLFRVSTEVAFPGGPR